MTWLSRLVRRNRVEAQLDAELRDHLDRQAADYVAAGMTEPTHDDAPPWNLADSNR